MYTNFLASKQRIANVQGIEPVGLHDALFPHQSQCVKWALTKTKSAIFADTGLGKALMELAWAEQVARHTSGKVLILAPLAVARQIEQEGIDKFNIPVRYCRSQGDADAAEEDIICTNYDMLHKFDTLKFAGVALDESSILKSFSGKVCNQILDSFTNTPFKLAASATPSPNDYEELGTHAEFLGVMSRVEMLATFFTHDSGSTQKWRLSGWAEERFWKWVATWSVMVTKPSDLDQGFDDTLYNLPPIQYHSHVTESGRQQEALAEGLLFAQEARTLNEQRKARRASLAERVKIASDLVNTSDEKWIVWCDLNDESTALTKAIPDAVQVTGSMKREEKEQAMVDFANGFIRVLVTKPSICGWGMNFQVCHNMAFVGLSNSFEQVYQATRRCWRFGQQESVNVHFVYAEDEGAVIRNIQRKESDFKAMQQKIIEAMQQGVDNAMFQTQYESRVETGNGWTAYQGDCVEVLSREIEPDSIGFSVFSPPFSSLYTYSASDRDMGNSSSDDQFFEHFKFAVDELYRVLMPGRIVAVHCAQIPAMKERDGYIGIKDFRGDLIRLFQEKGFIFHSEVTIWKDPVVEMQRTKALGLLHKQIKKDSAMSRQGIPDYLLMFRKPGVNPDPISGRLVVSNMTNLEYEIKVANWERWQSATHEEKIEMGCKAGHLNWDELNEDQKAELRSDLQGWFQVEGYTWEPEKPDTPDRELEKLNERQSIEVWQRYASPVWFDIDQGRTLQREKAREHRDERHICPLQLDVIERAIELWSNPGDLILSPFMGIGSEGYCALKMNRDFVGIELKPSYYRIAIQNLRGANQQLNLLDMLALQP